MKYEVKSTDKTLYVRICGEIDHHAAAPLRDATDNAIRESAPNILVIDMSGVELMDSSGFGFVMGRYKLMSLSGGSVTVTGCKERILKLLKMSGADRYVSIEGRK